MRLTKSEAEIMNVLWREGRALSRSEILTLSVDKTWKDSSIHILLNSLMRKGFIAEDGFVRSGKVWGRLYAPAITMDDYYANSVFAKSDTSELPQILSSMLLRDDVTPELIARLREILDKREAELK